MSGRLQTAVDSLSIVGGVWQDEPSDMGVFEHSAMIPARRGRGNLYILVETVGNFPDHAEIQQRVIRVTQEYFQTDGSITAGLREAIKGANVSLFETNLNAPREQRGVAGVTCVVLKDQDAFIGQIGPAVLFHIAKDKVEQLPQESTWLSSEKLEDVDIGRQPPLGLRRDIEPELSHLRVRDGDVFILACTSVAKLANMDQIQSAVLHRGAHSVRENLEAVLGGRDLSMLIVEVLSVEQAPAEAEMARPGVPERPGLGARLSSALRGLLITTPHEQEGIGAEEEGEERAGFGPAIDLKGAVQSAWRNVSKFLRGLIPVLARVLPEAGPAPPRERRVAGRSQEAKAAHADRRWVWLLLAIPAIIVLLFALTRFQYERSRQATLDRLTQVARDAKASAEASPAIAEQRSKLREALAALDEALQLKPGDSALAADRQSIQELLDGKNYVAKLLYFGELQEFPETESIKSQLSTAIVHGIDVYVLDLGMDRVYKYLLNQTRDGLQDLKGEAVLVRKGDARGEFTVDELLDIAWAEPPTGAAGSGLLILDKKGQMLHYDPDVGLKSLPIAGAEAWRGPLAAATYYTNLYLLDPSANTVLKYERTATGYDALPGNYFKPEANADVSNGIDIGIDGNVYVLHSDGRISKYFQGASFPFPQGNLDEPLNAPCCIFASGAPDQEGYVYVADAGNQRIVKFSKDGEFLRQYRSREPEYLSALKGLFVDEAEKRLYILNGNKLYWVSMPD